jgi:transcriptional regulator with XRE-family HTH domain
VATVRRWTGNESRALRHAMRLSTRDFATTLGVAVRTVTKWEAQGAGTRLRPDSQALLDTLLDRVDGNVQARFTQLVEEAGSLVDHGPPTVARRMVDGENRSPLPGRSVRPAGDLRDQGDDDVRRRHVLQG